MTLRINFKGTAEMGHRWTKKKISQYIVNSRNTQIHSDKDKITYLLL